MTNFVEIDPAHFAFVRRKDALFNTTPIHHSQRNFIREELAWAAGLFDGEGSTHTHRSANRERPRVTVSQANPLVLERFCNAVKIGKVYGPYNHGGTLANTPQWAYVAMGLRQAQAVIALLWTFLSPPKREQAQRVLYRMKHYREDHPPRNNWANRRPLTTEEISQIHILLIQGASDRLVARKLRISAAMVGQVHKGDRRLKDSVTFLDSCLRYLPVVHAVPGESILRRA